MNRDRLAFVLASSMTLCSAEFSAGDVSAIQQWTPSDARTFSSSALSMALLNQLKERRQSPWQQYHPVATGLTAAEETVEEMNSKLSHEPVSTKQDISTDYLPGILAALSRLREGRVGSGGMEEQRVKKFKLSFYDCIALYCSGMLGGDRNNCILKFCHRN